jgi:hypothetical protein
MVMELPNIIYQGEVKKFYLRVLRAFIYPFILYSLMMSIPFFWDKFRDTPAGIFWVFLNLLFMGVAFYSSYRWSKNHLYILAYKDKVFQLVYYHKDESISVLINEERIGSELKWTGRQKVLKLSIYDGERKIAEFYAKSTSVEHLSFMDIADEIDEIAKKDKPDSGNSME